MLLQMFLGIVFFGILRPAARVRSGILISRSSSQRQCSCRFRCEQMGVFRDKRAEKGRDLSWEEAWNECTEAHRENLQQFLMTGRR